MTKTEIAAVLEEVAALLELKGKTRSKSALTRMPRDRLKPLVAICPIFRMRKRSQKFPVS